MSQEFGQVYHDTKEAFFLNNAVVMTFQPQLAPVCHCHHCSHTVALLSSLYHVSPCGTTGLPKSTIQEAIVPYNASTLTPNAQLTFHTCYTWQHLAHTVTTVMVIISIGKLSLLYVPKSHDTFIPHLVDIFWWCTFQNITILSLLFSKTIIPGM
jgi:hypothetical protein